MRIVELPNLPDKGDVNDWLAAGGTKDTLLELASGVKPLTLEDLSEPEARPMGFRTVAEYLTEARARTAKKAYWAGILREGEVSMLAGRALAGKSTLACALTRALTLGIPLLGHACVKSRVGYMALERNGSAVARLFAAWNLESVAFLDETPNLSPAALAQFIEAEILKHKLEVVIVDHLQNLAKIRDSKDYSLVSMALEPLQKLAKKTGVHILVLHHQGKTERDGVIDVMGSEAYRAAVDALLEARARDGQHYVRGEIRGEADLPRTRVTVNLATGDVDEIDAGEAERRDMLTKIRDYLSAQSEPLAGDAIQEELGLKRAAMWAALNAGVEAGSIARTGGGRRGDAYLFFVPEQFSSRGSQYTAGTAGTESENGKSPNGDKGKFGSRDFGKMTRHPESRELNDEADRERF